MLAELDLPGDSDDEDEENPGDGTSTEPKEKSLTKKVKRLEAQLKEAREAVQQMRQLVQGRLNLLEPDSEAAASQPPRDDDSHYFNSYAYNGTAVHKHPSLRHLLDPPGVEIHAVMIQDTVRTTSYSKFILSNPMIFRGAVVMDVGCGRHSHDSWALVTKADELAGNNRDWYFVDVCCSSWRPQGYRHRCERRCH